MAFWRLIRRILDTLFEFLRSLLEGERPTGEPPPGCEIEWQPSLIAPVFYGARELEAGDGAPGAARVFFPSLDGAVFDAPILRACGRYPLVLFLHGHCTEPRHDQKWFELPATLARGGNVVLVPELPSIAAGVHPATDPNPDLVLLTSWLEWMRTEWEHAALLLPAPATAVAGHSFGALLGARLAAQVTVSAYASLSGVWDDWPSTVARPIESLRIPKLFTWGGDFDFFTNLDHSGLWPRIPTAKHKVVFRDGDHWDYLPARRTTCASQRGPCGLAWALAMDLVATFIGKYLPPEQWPGLRTFLPDSLVALPLSLSTEQAFFAGGHLMAMSLLQNRPECGLTIAWETSSSSGSIARP